MFNEESGDEGGISVAQGSEGDFGDDVVGFFALNDALELGLGGGGGLGGVELGDDLTGEAFLKFKWVDAAGSEGLGHFGDCQLSGRSVASLR